MTMDNQGIVNITNPHDGYIENFLISDHFTEKLVIVGLKGGELALPYGIAMDNKDHIRISEASPQRISALTCGGEFIHCFQACDKNEGLDDKEKCSLELWDLN